MQFSSWGWGEEQEEENKATSTSISKSSEQTEIGHQALEAREGCSPNTKFTRYAAFCITHHSATAQSLDL